MKRIASFILSFLACSFVIAQPRLRTPEISFGVQGGAMASMVNFSPNVTQSALNPYLGATAGLVFRYARHKYCGLQVELNWMQRGWKEKDTNYSRRMDYIEIPFLAHINFGNTWRGFFNIGPQIGYCIHNSEMNHPDLSDSSLTSTAQYGDITQPFDWGAAAGVGFLARTKAGVWQMEARFSYSLGSIFGTGLTDYFRISQPMSLCLTAAWLWEIKPKIKKQTNR